MRKASSKLRSRRSARAPKDSKTLNRSEGENMKKAISFILGALFAVSLVACGGSSSGQSTTPTPPAGSPDGGMAPSGDTAAPPPAQEPAK
jgi:hypothetical protein